MSEVKWVDIADGGVRVIGVEGRTGKGGWDIVGV